MELSETHLIRVQKETLSHPCLAANMTLTWESTYAIALALKRLHPDIDFEKVTLGQIYKWTLQLNEFEDDPSLANDDILHAIYQDWFEETLNG